MTVTELREALQRLEADGKGQWGVILDENPYLKFDSLVASNDFNDGIGRACLVNSSNPGHL